METDLLHAYFYLILAFLATAAASYLMFYLMLKQQHEQMRHAMEQKDKKAIKAARQDLKKQPWSWHQILMGKWMEFGGGFYGVIAVLTYVVVESREVYDFLTSEETIMSTIAALGVGDVVQFFINSLMNFITAITWPVYWMSKTTYFSTWIWFLVVYAGYVSGQYLAKHNQAADYGE